MDKSWELVESVIAFWRSPILIVDAKAFLRGSNPPAKRLLLHGSILKNNGGRVTAATESDTARLHNRIIQLIASSGLRPFSTLVLTAANGNRNAVILYALLSSHTDVNSGHVLLNVIDTQQKLLTVGSGVLKELFDLTEAEERVALLIGQGFSPHQMAAQLGVSMPTIRTHLSHIYDKTESRTQRDFLRLIGALGILETRFGTD